MELRLLDPENEEKLPKELDDGFALEVLSSCAGVEEEEETTAGVLVALDAEAVGVEVFGVGAPDG